MRRIKMKRVVSMKRIFIGECVVWKWKEVILCDTSLNNLDKYENLDFSRIHGGRLYDTLTHIHGHHICRFHQSLTRWSEFP
jgi:hypothetical protein